MKLFQQSIHKLLYVVASGLLFGAVLLQQLRLEWLVPAAVVFSFGVLFSAFLVSKPRSTAVQGCSVLVCVFLCAAAIGGARFAFSATDWRDQVAMVTEKNGAHWVVGEVISEPRVVPTTSSSSLRFLFRPEGRAGAIRVSWYRHGTINPSIGESWTLRLKVRRPDGFDNPNVGRYSAWLASQNVIALAYASGADAATRDTTQPASTTLTTLRGELSKVISHWLPEVYSFPVIQTLVTGEKSGYSEQLSIAVRRSGISHLLAISGLHIGLVASLGALWAHVLLLAGERLGWRISHWPARRLLVVVSGCGFAFCYAAISGFGVPAQRALVMLLIVALSLLAMRQPKPLAVLAWALIVVLMFDPMVSLQAGFWLSFVAVATILVALFGRRRSALITAETPWFARYGLRLWRNVSLLLRIQLALSIGLMPLTAMFFSQVSLVAPLANFVAVPVFSLLVVPIALGAALAGVVYLPLGAPLVLAERLATWTLDFCQQLLSVADGVASADWVSGQPAGVAVAAGLLGGLLLFAPRGVGLRLLGVFLVTLFVFSATPGRPANGALRLTMLDVGHGLAVHLQTEHHDMLYDTGARYGSGNSAANLVLTPYLQANAIRRLDRLVVSHADNDHSGGVEVVEQRFSIGERRGWGAQPCVAGEQWNWDGVNFEVIFPLRETLHASNDQSCVLRVTAAGKQLVLTGDIETPAERQLLGKIGKADLLSAPHHGSKTSSHQAWLNEVSPSVVLVSAARKGRFNLPHPDVLERYEQQASTVLVTHSAGGISVSVAADGELEITGSRRSTPWWLADLP